MQPAAVGGIEEGRVGIGDLDAGRQQVAGTDALRDAA
jgi:hypothetical protein